MNSIANDIDRTIFQEEFQGRLPSKLFDIHVHLWDETAFPTGFRFPEKHWANRFGGTFPFSLWRQVMSELLPGHEVNLNCFGLPHGKADRDRAPAVSGGGNFTMALVSPADSGEELCRRIEGMGAVGVKPYWNFAADYFRKNAAEVEIADMLTAPQLEYLNAKKLAVMLHIPRPGRFADPVNRRQMLELCGKYPDVRFIFAHIGRAYFLRNIRESNLDELAECPNAFFDTAMICNVDVFRHAFDHFPASRIMFGSDAPIAFLRGKSVEINHQYAYLMGEDYPIGTSIYDSGHAVNFTTFFYEQLRALLETAPADELENILYHNAVKFFRSTEK